MYYFKGKLAEGGRRDRDIPFTLQIAARATHGTAQVNGSSSVASQVH